MIDFDDDTMDGEFALMKEIAKQNHDERVAKTPDRIEYAIKRFTDEGIKYKILNHQIGHFHIWDEQGNLFQFWASTGKIYYDKKTKDARNLKPLNDSYRGIENCIKLLRSRHFGKWRCRHNTNLFTNLIDANNYLDEIKPKK